MSSLNFNFNNRHKTIYKLLLISNSLEYDIQRMLKPFDLTLSQYCLLRVLRHNYPLPTNTMALRYEMIDKMSDITRLISRLHQRDLLSKKGNPDDKRITEVFITEKGQILLKKIEQELGGKELLEQFNNEQVENLQQLLNEMIDSTPSSMSILDK